MSTAVNNLYEQLPSPPLSPCNDSYDELEPMVAKESEKVHSGEGDHLRNQYMKMIEEGIKDGGENIPYLYAVEKLHRMGHQVINKKTKDAVPLRIYEIGKDSYEDYWVHPIFLSLQSFPFFKLFEQVKKDHEQGWIEIEVPSLQTFRVILYYLYTGDRNKLLEIAKLDETICKGIIENINYLEINF